MNFGPQIP